MKDLENCRLCEHRCGVNRLKGEKGVCSVTLPEVSSACLHSAPPESYTVFVAGCNYKCLNCQNWTISQYPDNKWERIRGFIEPEDLAKECISKLRSPSARLMGADRIFFSGGEATIHLPYIEEVVRIARIIWPEVKVNFDTNGYLTEESLERVLKFTTSITYDIKAFSDEVHKALTGVPAGPVLRNAGFIAKNAEDKLWEFRILVIPGINEEEIEPLSRFLAEANHNIKVKFLAFRPNYLQEEYPGASYYLMEKAVHTAKRTGLTNVSWSGHPGLPGIKPDVEKKLKGKYSSSEALMAASIAFRGGCNTHPRDCRICSLNKNCEVKKYIPGRNS